MMRDEGLPVAARDGSTRSLATGEVESLRSRLGGELLTPGADGYETARRVWNGTIDRHPAMIVRCASELDVVHAVRFARQHGLVVSVRGGGHNVAGIAVKQGALVIDLSRMRRVNVDPLNRVVYVQGGARIKDVDAASQAHGLAVPLGVVSATGIGGLTLGGGVGWLTRKFGLSADNLLAVDVVTADGTLLRADANHNKDLLWALCGGGGNFGVVTRFEYQAYAVGPTVWRVMVMHPLERAQEGLRFFRDYVSMAPVELGVLATLWNGPDESHAPPEVRGKPVFIIVGCCTGPLEDAERMVEPIRTFASPSIDQCGPVSFVDMQCFLDPDYPDGRNYHWKSLFVQELSEPLIDKLVEVTRTRPSALTSLDVWDLHGSMRRVPTHATAFFRRHHPYLVAIESNWDDPAATPPNRDWTRKVADELRAFSDGAAYLNFPGMAEDALDLSWAAYGDNMGELSTIKMKYVSDNMFQGNAPIPKPT